MSPSPCHMSAPDTLCAAGLSRHGLAILAIAKVADAKVLVRNFDRQKRAGSVAQSIRRSEPLWLLEANRRQILRNIEVK